MLLTRLKAVVALVLAVGFLTAGAGLAAYRTFAAPQPGAQQPDGAKSAADGPGVPRPAGEKRGRTDRYGDPLPPGAIARMGTVRFRHGSAVTGLAFTPDGKTLISGSYDQALRLWDPSTGRERRRIPGLHGSVFDFALSRDGRAVAVVAGSMFHHFDVPAGKLTRPVLRPIEERTCAALSPDGRTLAAGCWDQAAGTSAIRLWEAATGKPLGECKGHEKKVTRVAFSPGGEVLASGGQDRTVRLWGFAAGTERRRLRTDGAVQALTFAPDGRVLASGCEGGTLHLWDPATGKGLHRFRAHSFGAPAVAFSPDGKALASGGDGTVCLWDVATGQRRHRLYAAAEALAFAPDGATLASGGHDCRIRLWDVATGKERPSGASGHLGPLWAPIALSADGTILATVGGGMIHLWEVATGRELHRLNTAGPWPCHVALSRDGKVVASEKCVWDAASGKELRRFPRQQHPIQALAFSPDGKILAMGSDDPAAGAGGMVRLWDAAAATEIRSFGGQPVRALRYSPDGKVLAAGNRDGCIGLWDPATGQERGSLRGGHQREVDSVAFSPDGQSLASSSFDGVVVLWDVATGRERQRLGQAAGAGHRSVNVLGVAFAPDGRSLATAEMPYASPDGHSIVLWELATGQARLKLAGHQGDVTAVAFAGDGKTLVSASADTTALAWDVTSPALHGRVRAKDLAEKDLEALWADLRGDGAAQAYRAICALAANPGPGVPFLARRLRPAPAAGPRVRRLIGDLDSDRFPVREKAAKGLRDLGLAAEPALRAALRGRPSAEVRRRLEQLLEGLERERLPTLRALEALELIGRPEARAALEALAQGAPEAWMTREAKATLGRLARRPASRP
jgi:WD40 repeat protein